MNYYLPEPSQWTELATRLLAAESPIGFDTEYYSTDPTIKVTERSARFARVHVFSLAYFTGLRHPSGYLRAQGHTLPAAALTHPRIRYLLECPTLLKVGHNASVDVHAIGNTAGVGVGWVHDTLQDARWLWPERTNNAGFGLKSLMVDKLGRKPMGDFKDLFSRPVTRSKLTKRKQCACGVAGCKKRLLPEHVKTEVIDRSEQELKKRELVPLPEITPGHEMWPVLEKYAAEDAEAALELYSLIERSEPGYARRGHYY